MKRGKTLTCKVWEGKEMEVLERSTSSRYSFFQRGNLVIVDGAGGVEVWRLGGGFLANWSGDKVLVLRRDELGWRNVDCPV
jgi:hypothetical protein